MSGWIILLLFFVGTSQPTGTGDQLKWAQLAWAVVMLAIATAGVVDSQGWP